MYRNPVWNLVSQGDVYRRKCVFPYILNLVDDYLVARDEQEDLAAHSALAGAWSNGSSETVLMPTFAHDHFIVLSSSCDVDGDVSAGDKPPLELVLVGAVFPLAEIAAKNQDSCRRNKVLRYHCLQENLQTNFPESVIHFGLVASVRQESLVQSKALRIQSLDYPYREDLGHRFGEFISRVALP
jgi:hypothetical protein